MAFVNLMETLYPVGAVYISTSSTSPATLIGGTWSQVKGCMLAATGTTGYASAAAYKGDTTIALKHLPEGRVRFRTIALTDNNLMLSASGLFTKETEPWSGTHAAFTKENWSPYNCEYLCINGGGARLLALPLWSLRLVQDCVDSLAVM